MVYYLCVGVGVYLGMAAKETDSLSRNDWKSIGRGVLLTVPGWPLMLVLVAKKRL